MTTIGVILFSSRRFRLFQMEDGFVDFDDMTTTTRCIYLKSMNLRYDVLLGNVGLTEFLLYQLISGVNPAEQ